MQELHADIAAQLNIQVKQVSTVLELLAGGATIPFIARYRKDRTGALDEVQILDIQNEAKSRTEFNERKEFIIKTISDQGIMTDALLNKIHSAKTMAVLEDIYLPYKPKRKTKAQTARDFGLVPLALILLEQQGIDPVQTANTFVTENVKTAEDALQGARDIIAEMVNEHPELRAAIRKLFEDAATVQSRVLSDKEAEGIKYKDYFDFSEPVSKIPSHRILAIMRGFMEGVLRMTIAPKEDAALAAMEKIFVTSNNTASEQVKKAVKDAYRRLLQPSLESEFRTMLKQRADGEAINVFAENLRQLLLSAPLGGRKLLAIDPGYRTGCKIVCLGENGELEQTGLIYIHEPGKLASAENKIRSLVATHHIRAFAIGDGTAGRETEQFIKSMKLDIPVFMVNEDGASVYSASDIAREEFPEQDITIRGAVSIGRRLMDPLAELVKIEPKSIGVGQYQHDVNQVRLKEHLDQTVISCVNRVGVNLNTASKHLLAYVSGIGPSLAENIIKYRNETGKFASRRQLLKVPRLGNKVFEQCAGFLRIKDGDDPLDASAVHPEAYDLVGRMARDLSVPVQDLVGNEGLVAKINVADYISETVGMLTIRDILTELKKPGIDPRSEVQQFEFANIFSIADVSTGMIVPGVVTNITRFGAFIDIGVKQDGLVHISEVAHTYITDPGQVLKLNQQVTVKVLEVDIPRKRIALSIKQTQELPAQKERSYQQVKKDTLKAPGVENIEDALSMLKKKFGK